MSHENENEAKITAIVQEADQLLADIEAKKLIWADDPVERKKLEVQAQELKGRMQTFFSARPDSATLTGDALADLRSALLFSKAQLQQIINNYNTNYNFGGSGNKVNTGSGTFNDYSKTYNYGPPQVRSCPAPYAPPEYFGGRDGPMADLKARLRSGQTTMITAVQGMGGMGKTTLARQLAHDLYHNPKEKIFRAVLWADVTQAPNLTNILSNWARFAEPKFDPGGTQAADLAEMVRIMLTEVIAEKCATCEPSRVLVVLDDVWDNSVEEVRLLQRACPSNATILLTSRSDGLAVRLQTQTVPLSGVKDGDSVALLKTYLDWASDADLLKLAQLLGGHPLALSLAARRVKSRRSNQPAALKNHLAEYETGLPAGISFADLDWDDSTSLNKLDNLTLAFSYSYEDLSEAEKGYFRGLGALAYAQPFDISLLAAVWEVSEEQADTLCENVRASRLASLGMVEPDPTIGPGWYRSHPLLMTYAKSLARQVGELEAVAARHVAYYQKLAWAAGNGTPRDYPLLDLHQPNLLAGLDWSKVHDPARFVNTVIPLDDYFIIRCEFDLFRHYFEAAATAAQDPLGQANTLRSLGDLEFRLSEYDLARDYLNRALPLYDKAQDPLGQASTLISLGDMYLGLEDKIQARQNYERALPLARKAQAFLTIANVLVDLGRLRFEAGEREQGLQDLTEAAELFRKARNEQWAQEAEERLAKLRGARNGRKRRKNGWRSFWGRTED